MTNKELLRSKIALQGMSQSRLAEQMEINKNTLSYKIAGTKDFSQTEIQKIMNILQLSPSDVVDIFLS